MKWDQLRHMMLPYFSGKAFQKRLFTNL